MNVGKLELNIFVISYSRVKKYQFSIISIMINIANKHFHQYFIVENRKYLLLAFDTI